VFIEMEIVVTTSTSRTLSSDRNVDLILVYPAAVNILARSRMVIADE
jgi:hypothetical protein